MKILLIYHSFDGQAARVAHRIGDAIGQAGHAVTLHRFGGPGAFDTLARYDAVIVGAAIRFGRPARDFEAEVKRHAPELAAMPNAFFSVSLSAGGPGHKPDAVRRFVDAFQARTGWTPGEVASFAGALPYTRYNPLLRLVMKFIVHQAGGETDTRRDHEYTDWGAVEAFGRRFAHRLAPRAAA